MSGRGRIYAFTIMHERSVVGFEDAVPYACIAVELAEQPRLIVVSNLVGAPATAARVGMLVAVEFEQTSGGVTLPQFRPDQG
jgi:uncharacterized OB-fold protein